MYEPNVLTINYFMPISDGIPISTKKPDTLSGFCVVCTNTFKTSQELTKPVNHLIEVALAFCDQQYQFIFKKVSVVCIPLPPKDAEEDWMKEQEITECQKLLII